MARELVIRITIDKKTIDEAGRYAEEKFKEAGRRASSAFSVGIESGSRRVKSAIDSNTAAFDALKRAAIGLAGALGAVGGAFGLARTAFDAARDIDRTRSSIAAMTGSLDAANKKMAELRKISQESIGVTNTLATSVFTSFKAMGNVTDKTINDLIRGMGRLNAAFGLDDPNGFARNLQQIFTQGFERSDIKEALGRVPIFEQLLRSAFGTDDPDKLRKMKAAGTLTMETFAKGIAEAIENSAILKSIPESIGAKFDKLKDRLKTSLEPVGGLIADVLLTATNRLASAVEGLAPKSENAFARFRFALQETIKQTDALIARVATLGSSLTEGVRRLIDENTIVSQQMTSATIGFLNDLFEGRNPLEPGSRANRIGRLNRMSNRGVADPTNIPGAPSRFNLFGADQKLLADRKNRRGDGGNLGGAAAARIDRAAEELIEMRRKIAEGNAEFIEQAVEDLKDLDKALQGINLTGEAVRRQRPLDLEALPRLPLIAPGIPETLGGPLRSLMEEAAEIPEKIVPIMSDAERLMRGLEQATLSVGDAFERFGQSVAFAFTNVRSLFDGLKRAVLDFFNDLVGSALQNLVRNTLGGLFGGGGGGGFFQQAFAGAGGGGISAPPSVSGGGGILSRIGSFFSGGGGASPLAFPGAQSPEFFNVSGGVGGGSFLGGIGRSFAGAAPFLGLGLGGGLGGQSITGQIAGSAGGLLAGGLAAAKFAPGALSAKAAAFFTNPFTIAIGAGLLVGSFFLGKAAQRKKDEEASGQFLTQALQGIEQLAAGVSSGQITTLAEARSIFDRDILGVFRQQISSLKTKSVRDSRLTNQVRDLENVFQSRIPPLIADQERRAADAARFAEIDRRLIPEFAVGGTVQGIDRGRDSVLAMVRPGEKILTRLQQSAVIAQSNPSVFDRAGVPRGAMFAGGAQSFQFGGTAQPSSFAQPIEISFTVVLGMSKSGAQEIAITGMQGPRGRQVVVKHIDDAQTNREL